MRRVALISDAHGNAVGLRAALDDVALRSVDAIVSLGDVAHGGPQPVKCVDLVRGTGALTVMGNSDAFLLDPHASGEDPTERQLVQREWTLAQLSDADLDYLRSFAPTIELELGGRRLLCFHGTPAGYDGVVLPEDPPEAFAGTGADVLAGGHVHVPQLRRVGSARYVNPGSVGLGYDHLQPEDDFRIDPWASYAIVDASSIEFYRVPFDLRARSRDTGEWAPARRGSLEPLPAFLTAMRLYNSQLSGNCWKVRQILALREIEYERIEVDVFDRSNRPDLLGGKNPALRVPTLELDNGEFLAESNAILWFFGDGSAYVPHDPLERARVLQWMFFEQYELEPTIAVARFWIGLLGERDTYAAELEAKWRGGNRALAALDGHLEGREWLVGNGFTIADISLYAYTHVAEEGDFDLGRYPNVQTWIDRVAGQPGYQPLDT